ncbi:hypothetical protein [Methanothermococcus okinawensis]|uniref:Uncharacterized protein n=1 Tax=Methanothermococcus okinawensis (strain DSM 14208 / JCM 11175 / IH1) TaxID=647113 RepID=F8AKV7_METOI|nr:hypothetical protein [Methanothermococcus okinawensis]AEH07579.1 hypothetical protein Metok_1616 [Methanothermococcus okinawensis IH1]
MCCCVNNNLDRTGDNRENGIIVVNITVICDNPISKNYVLIKGEPKNVSLYRFYYINEDIPGSGVFEKIKTIPLKKIRENKYLEL